MEELTRQNLYKYLRTVQKAVQIKNADVDPARISEEEWADFCMREGASRLAEELIQKYALAVSDN